MAQRMPLWSEMLPEKTEFTPPRARKRRNRLKPWLRTRAGHVMATVVRTGGRYIPPTKLIPMPRGTTSHSLARAAMINSPMATAPMIQPAIFMGTPSPCTSQRDRVRRPAHSTPANAATALRQPTTPRPTCPTWKTRSRYKVRTVTSGT